MVIADAINHGKSHPGDVIRGIRSMRRLTQQQLADLTRSVDPAGKGVHVQTLIRFEKTGSAGIDTVRLLCKALDVPVSQVIDDDPAPASIASAQSNSDEASSIRDTPPTSRRSGSNGRGNARSSSNGSSPSSKSATNQQNRSRGQLQEKSANASCHPASRESGPAS